MPNRARVSAGVVDRFYVSGHRCVIFHFSYVPAVSRLVDRLPQDYKTAVITPENSLLSRAKLDADK
jgi:hypothetical protein